MWELDNPLATILLLNVLITEEEISETILTFINIVLSDLIIYLENIKQPTIQEVFLCLLVL